MESILEPSKDIDPAYKTVQVVTLKGTVVTGLRVNESNFNIQLREENGRFHSFLKNDLETVTVDRLPIETLQRQAQEVGPVAGGDAHASAQS